MPNSIIFAGLDDIEAAPEDSREWSDEAELVLISHGAGCLSAAAAIDFGVANQVTAIPVKYRNGIANAEAEGDYANYPLTPQSFHKALQLAVDDIENRGVSRASAVFSFSFGEFA